jgi:hypothetical protein
MQIVVKCTVNVYVSVYISVKDFQTPEAEFMNVQFRCGVLYIILRVLRLEVWVTSAV